MSEHEGEAAAGGCLCGAVRYRLRGPLRAVVNCHCGQCRRFHGHYGAYTDTTTAKLSLTGEDRLAWFQSSSIARRGFCRDCGSSLFWQRLNSERISVAAGTLDEPTGLSTVRHIFVKDKGDYYEIADGLEQVPGTMGD